MGQPGGPLPAHQGAEQPLPEVLSFVIRSGDFVAGEHPHKGSCHQLVDSEEQPASPRQLASGFFNFNILALTWLCLASQGPL